MRGNARPGVVRRVARWITILFDTGGLWDVGIRGWVGIWSSNKGMLLLEVVVVLGDDARVDGVGTPPPAPVRLRLV